MFWMLLAYDNQPTGVRIKTAYSARRVVIRITAMEEAQMYACMKNELEPQGESAAMLATRREGQAGRPQETGINPVMHHSWGIVCLHCGAHVPLRASAEHAADRDRPPERVSLVWCQVCLREAAYLPREVVDMNQMPTTSYLWGKQVDYLFADVKMP